MTRVAVFVDAGYLFAQGSTCLTGSTKSRKDLRLNESEALAALKHVASTMSDGAQLLRIYWYDGADGYRGPTLEQISLADSNNVKVRLGFINSNGQQKGVDSLIVTDLIDLARNRAMTDAVLLSGDEDVRVGVQVAQTFGVRVHLLGIAPCRGSQSRQLIQEADTTTEWTKGIIETFLTTVIEHNKQIGAVEPSTANQLSDREKIDETATAIANALDPASVTTLINYWETSGDIPREFDGTLLGKCRLAVNRDLDISEKRQARSTFRNAVKSTVQN